jgi:hypothetical protein
MTIAAYRHLPAAAAVRYRTDRHPAQRARHRVARRAADCLVPRASRARPRPHDPDTQQPARGDPLAVRLSRAAPPRTCRHDPTRARDPAQAHHQEPADLPHRARGQRAARRLRPAHLDRPTRPHDARAIDRNRPADLRTDCPGLPGHHARDRRQRPHHRHRQKSETNTLTPPIRRILTAWLRE